MRDSWKSVLGVGGERYVDIRKERLTSEGDKQRINTQY